MTLGTSEGSRHRPAPPRRRRRGLRALLLCLIALASGIAAMMWPPLSVALSTALATLLALDELLGR